MNNEVWIEGNEMKNEQSWQYNKYELIKKTQNNQRF